MTTPHPSRSSTHHVHELHLDPDERYDVYVVKAAERPHLLTHSPSPPPPNDDEKKSSDGSCCCNAADDEEEEVKPLIDGCDIPGWRKEGLIPTSDEIRGALNVGVGSSMFRRESQWPIVLAGREVGQSCGKKSTGRKMGVWDKLRDTLLVPPDKDRDAPVVQYEEYSRAVVDEEGMSSCERSRRRRTSTKFAWEFEQRNVPAKVMGATLGWDAMPKYASGDAAETTSERRSCGEKGLELPPVRESGFGGWTFENLLSRFGHISWRFSDQHGEMLPLSTYAKYISSPEGLTDDSPLAIYDAEFGDDPPTNVLLNEYRVPKCFSPDLFDLADYDAEEGGPRPPYRWILIGPSRSGTGMHVDPLWTNAWVTVLEGVKRWMLFPPATPPDRVGMVEGQPQIPSVIWFRDYYTVVTAPSWPEEWKPVEVLQRPGETVFVPNGWMHLVLNLELTMAVTHNYASEFGPFERMWREVVVEEPDFARRWYRGMRERREDLARRVWEYHIKAQREERDSWASGFALPEWDEQPMQRMG